MAYGCTGTADGAHMRAEVRAATEMRDQSVLMRTLVCGACRVRLAPGPRCAVRGRCDATARAALAGEVLQTVRCSPFRFLCARAGRF